MYSGCFQAMKNQIALIAIDFIRSQFNHSDRVHLISSFINDCSNSSRTYAPFYNYLYK